jgi:hypothetical protein
MKNQQRYAELTETLKNAISKISEEIWYVEGDENNSLLVPTNEQIESILNYYKIDWEKNCGPSIPNHWFEQIWGEITSDEEFDKIIETVEYKDLSQSCLDIWNEAWLLGLSENIEAEIESSAERADQKAYYGPI